MGDLLVKATVLLAAWQGARFLPAQLQSLADQTFSDFDLLYQDDGSGDDTRHILEARARQDSRLHPGIQQGQRLGPVKNFFSLMQQAADSDYVFLCDQDDLWEPRKMETLLRAARESACADKPLLVHSDASLIDDRGNPLSESFFRRQGWDPRAVGLNRLLVQNNVTGCTLMMNRPLVRLIISYGRPERMFMHDWFCALTAASFGHILFVNEPLVRYRQHGDNVLGASRRSLMRRGMEALRGREESRARITLTYTTARAFLDAFGDALPSPARETVDRYLATESMPRLQRIRAVRAGGYLMQSPITRLGQLLFG